MFDPANIRRLNDAEAADVRALMRTTPKP
jgi:hypothetical protein